LPVDCVRELLKESASLQWKKNWFRFFCEWGQHEIVFWSFWLMLPVLGPNHKREEFRSSFYWKLV